MDNIVSVKLDSRYASTLGVWQYDYGQVLRITGPELPPAVEVQFSLDEKSGETLSRVGTTVDGVTEVKIPDELLTHSATSNYRIYAYIYLTDETSGNTKYEITIPVRVRSKPTSPTEDPETDPDLFRETVVAVNASAERAENAASSAMESAASVDETLEEIKRVADGISEDIENANTAKSELSGMINGAGIEKKELESSIGKAGEAKTSLDSSISSAGEKKLALDATVEQANEVDASLKEQIGSAEQIQANVEQIAKNKADISSLNEDLADLKDKKITKFYASNQGENHLADSDDGKIQDMVICGNSNQNQTKGKNLLKYPYVEATKMSLGVTFMDNKDGSINVSGIGTGVAYYDLYSNRDGKRLTLASGTYKLVTKGRSKCNVSVNNGVNSAKNEGTFTVTDGHNDVWCYIEAPKGLELDETIYPMIQLASITDESYEPYTGGNPSPSPDYPQEIKSVVNPVVKVCGKNLYNARAYPLIGNGYNGLTVQKKDDYYTIVGTATAETVLWLCGSYNNRTPLFTLKKGNYALTSSLTIDSSTGDVRKKVTGIFSIDEDYPVTGVCAAYQKGDVLNNKLYVQIEKGSEATSYEPYTEQSVQLPYTLNAIPVASGGNVTINGQQYIADYVDVERGKVVRKIGKLIITGKENWMLGFENWTTYPHAFRAEELKKDILKGNTMNAKYTWYQKQANLDLNSMNAPYNKCIAVSDARFSSVNEFTNELKKQDSNGTPLTVYYVTDTPQEENLSLEEIEFLKSLSTYYPVTNISVNSEQLDGYTVFNYPISMANGWNYVKQQLGDTRDYIYDMDAKAQDIDTQAAEAYVNSEYAVALTELEV